MRRTLWLAAACVASAACVSVLWAAAEAQKVETTMLFDFEEENALTRFDADGSETAISTEHATSGKQSLKTTLKAGAERTCLYTERFPVKDWSEANFLKFDVFAEEAVTLTLTIKDPNSKNYDTRFNQDEVMLNKGANTVTISMADVAAKIDLKKIKSMTLGTSGLAQDTVFYLDNVRLEK